MPAPEEPRDSSDPSRCRHFVWETSPEDGRPVPGRYCQNPLGVIQDLDCPVFRGLACRFFDARPETEAPILAAKAELASLRAALAEIYLRWPYRRLVASLVLAAQPEPAPAAGRADPGLPHTEERQVAAVRRREHPSSR